MFGYIYKTTNLINGKIYIGQHKSETFDTKYYGSGKLFRKAFKLKVSKSLSNKPRPYRYKPFYIGDVYFNCMQEAAEYYGVTKACINV